MGELGEKPFKRFFHVGFGRGMTVNIWAPRYEKDMFRISLDKTYTQDGKRRWTTYLNPEDVMSSIPLLYQAIAFIDQYNCDKLLLGAGEDPPVAITQKSSDDDDSPF